MSKRARTKPANAGNKPSSPSAPLAPLGSRARYPVKETAAFLGISTAQVWKRIWSGELGHVREGARVLVLHEEIQRYARLDHKK
jgi:hypothetical protein